MKVLLVLDHAPDYRESFLRQLGNRVELTVVAQPLEPDGLCPPKVRSGYSYVELSSRDLLGFRWQSRLMSLFRGDAWDVICCDLNLRHLARIVSFSFVSSARSRWVWRGHVYGKNNSVLFHVIKKYLLRRGCGCLVYSDIVAERVARDFKIDAVSFNNSQVSIEEFMLGAFDQHTEIRFLFVGRNQPRKKLFRLIDLVRRHNDIRLRMVGPSMDSLSIPQDLIDEGRVEVFGKTMGNELVPHFKWADMVVNPGHVGLLAINAARYGKGIVIDSLSQHAPEYWIAKESCQPFIPFESEAVVDRFIDHIRKNRWKFAQWGEQLQDIAKRKYTIEFMADAHIKVFTSVVGN